MSWYYCNKCVRVYEGRDDGTDVCHPPCSYAAVAVDAREKELRAKLRAAEEKAAALEAALTKIAGGNHLSAPWQSDSYRKKLAEDALAAIEAARAKEQADVI